MAPNFRKLKYTLVVSGKVTIKFYCFQSGMRAGKGRDALVGKYPLIFDRSLLEHDIKLYGTTDSDSVK